MGCINEPPTTSQPNLEVRLLQARPPAISRDLAFTSPLISPPRGAAAPGGAGRRPPPERRRHGTLGGLCRRVRTPNHHWLGPRDQRRPAPTSRGSTRAGCHVPHLARPPPTSPDLPRPPQPEIFETACFFVTLFHRYADAQARAAARGRGPLPASAHPWLAQSAPRSSPARTRPPTCAPTTRGASPARPRPCASRPTPSARSIAAPRRAAYPPSPLRPSQA